MYWKHFFALITASILFVSCDDNTSTLGMDMIPAADLIAKTYKTYDVKTSSYAVGDSVLSRTSTSYFGQYTDPITGSTVKSDFLSQYNCPINKLKNEILGDTAHTVNIVFNVSQFVGDSLAPLSLEVYELDSLLDPNADYYTNIDPSKFVKKDAKPVGSIRFSAKNFVKNLEIINIPIDRAIGDDIIAGLKKDPSLAEPSKWLKSGLRGSKGFYFKLCSGDGAMYYFSDSQMNVTYRYHDTEADKDSISLLDFEGSEEVVQASRFATSNIKSLIDDDSATYLKCPAGIFTMAEIPLDSISANDTINSASIKFIRYNDDAETNSKIDKKYRLGIPENVLLVRYDEYKNGFFESYKLNDNVTSYLAPFSSAKNAYEFSDISRLITTMIQEKKSGKASENYNKVLIIPVAIETTGGSGSYSKVVKINHDFSMKSTRLVGGKDGGVKIELIYSKFIR